MEGKVVVRAGRSGLDQKVGIGEHPVVVDDIQMMDSLDGPLISEQRERLMEIATKCPVRRTLQGEVKIRSTALSPSE